MTIQFTPASPDFQHTTQTQMLISYFHRSTRSFNSFPALKNGSFFGLIFKFSLFFGFRQVYTQYPAFFWF